MGSESSARQVTLRYLKPTSHTVEGVLSETIDDLSAAGLCEDSDVLFHDALARQQQSPTGMPGRIAIPHCRSVAVSKPSVSVLKLSDPVDFGGSDGAADVVFFIAIPAGADKSHMKILSSLARAVVRTELVQNIRLASDGEEVTELVRGALATKKKDSSQSVRTEDRAKKKTRVVAITSCPTGVAHTYLAADALMKAAKRSGIDLLVETQGASDNSALSRADIDRAEVAIIASAVGIEGESRLGDLPVLRVDAREAVDNPAAVLERSLTLVGSQPQRVQDGRTMPLIARALLSGVSMIMPVLMIAGLAITIGLLIEPTDTSAVTALASSSAGHAQVQLLGTVLSHANSLASSLVAVGLLALLGSPAIMSMAVASSLSPRAGRAPGLVLGLLAVALGTGFVGGLVAGVLAGAVSRALSRWRLPPSVAPAVPIVIVPVACIFLAFAFYLTSPVISSLYDAVLAVFTGVPATGIVGVAIILAVAINWDFGGLINKVAYGIAVVGLTTATNSALVLMAAAMVAGMVGPIALGLVTRNKSAFLSGLLFITEPVLDYISQQPRAAWVMRLGGAIAAAISSAAGVGMLLPHGGVLAVVGAADNAGAWLGALVTGVLVSAAGLKLTNMKKRGAPAPR